MRYVIKLVLGVKPEQSEGKNFSKNSEKGVKNGMVLLRQYKCFILHNIFFIYQKYSVFSTLTKFSDFCRLVLIFPTSLATKNYGGGAPAKSASEHLPQEISGCSYGMRFQTRLNKFLTHIQGVRKIHVQIKWKKYVLIRYIRPSN